MQVLEKCLNFFNCECSGLYQKCFLMLFGCLRQRIHHSSEKLKVIYIKRFCLVQELIINLRQANRECGEANSSGLKVSVSVDWEFAVLYNLWNYIPGRWSLKIECGPWRVLWNSCNFLYEPCDCVTFLYFHANVLCCQSECARSIIVTINPLQSPPLK